MWGDTDLGAEVIRAGGAEVFLSRTSSLRDAAELVQACQSQRAALQQAAEALRAGLGNATDESHARLIDCRARLKDCTARARAVVSEFKTRQSRLQTFLDSFEEHRIACLQEKAVAKCRIIADAYVNVLKALNSHRQDDAPADMDAVAANIEQLIREVEAVRREGPKSLFGESLAVNKRILASFENRCVDSVIKARAAFVNVMDNEFRSFGWPMKVPVLGENQEMISHVNFYVRELKTLQQVAERHSFVALRTKWHRSLSDSWAMAAILRAPLARFKYHFLENYRAASSSTDGNAKELDSRTLSQSGMPAAVDFDRVKSAENHVRASTVRFDRPEWAAEFALARVAEAAPFLKEIVLDDTCTADLKFAEGFCKVFANKIAYDCDLAIRASETDSSADLLVTQAAGTAGQFDEKLRDGIVSNNAIYHKNDHLPSSLDFLSTNDTFFANWASAEQRIAQSRVLDALGAVLQPTVALSTSVSKASLSGVADQALAEDVPLDVELECAEIVDKISEASRSCRGLRSWSRIMTFVRWTELHLLQAVRADLQEKMNACGWQPRSFDDFFLASRVAWIAHVLACALRNKSCDPFYVSLLENSDERVTCEPSADDMEGKASSSVYAAEIAKLDALSKKTCIAVGDAMADAFVDDLRLNYLSLVQFGELPATDAAVVLEHDLSEALCGCMSDLGNRLHAVQSGVSNRKISAAIWRPVARSLDNFFFEVVIMGSFTGGPRNAVSAASEANEFMSSLSAAKMSRQIAYDASALVKLFSVVTHSPERFICRTAEASHLLRLGATRVIRPKSPLRQGDDEVIAELSRPEGENKYSAITILETVGKTSLSWREARECLVIAGLYQLLPLD